ncbi:MAG: amidohydrolase family protein [Chloroflexi bacterium]|nr:amidohydrolase family protein [Chloroflexota bacterium]
MAILDCHDHAWRYPEHFNVARLRANLPLEQRSMGEEEIKKMRDRPVEVVLNAAKEGSVDHTLILGLKSGDTIGAEVPNEWIAEAVKPYPSKLWWAAAVVMTQPGAAAEAERCIRDLGAVALGEIGPAYAHYSIDDPRCFPVYEVAQSYDIPMLIHAGPVGSRNGHVKYGDLSALDEVCINFPELKVVLCHLGGQLEPRYEQATHLLGKHPNLYADLSGMPRSAGLGTMPNPPAVVYPFSHLDHPILFYFSHPARNQNKLLWGTDMQRSKESIEAFGGINSRLKKMGLPTIPEVALERIFHENWRPVFTKIK